MMLGMQEHLQHRFAEGVDTRRLFRLLFEESGPRHADLAVEFLPERESLVYDLGCSTGTTLSLLAAHPRCPRAARFVGIDNSAAMLAEARAKLEKAAPRVERVAERLDDGQRQDAEARAAAWLRANGAS